jgi:hypothetical protein
MSAFDGPRWAVRTAVELSACARSGETRFPLRTLVALDVSGREVVRPGGTLTGIDPFDDAVRPRMDLYDLFIDRRRWPDMMLSAYRATRHALTPFARRGAQRRSGNEAAGS